MIKDKDKNLDLGEISTHSDLNRAKEFIINKYGFELDVDIEISERFKRKAGEYNPVKGKIKISKHLLENHSEKVIETLKHEIAHAEVISNYGDSKPHGKEWKSVMKHLGIENPQACHNLKLTEYNYFVECSNPDCDTRMGRHRKSKLVKKPELYRCTECGSKLESFELSD